MKRSFVVACGLALALVLGLSATVGASTQVSAEPAAKKGAKKGKSCKGKAGKSAAAQAKKKSKSKGCKAKGKAKSKGTPTPTPTPAPPAAAPFGDGIYNDPATSVELNVSGGATTAVLKYVPPGFCAGITYTSQPVTLTKNGDTWAANETRSFTIIGEPANVKWDLTVKEGLTYALNFTMESDSIIGLCKGEGHPTGTLTKVG